jgi:hypothetical protein
MRTRSVVLSLVLLATFALSACGTEPAAPQLEGLTRIDEAARAAEQAFGVPADLTLAVAYAETRWQQPTEAAPVDAAEPSSHAPLAVGLGGLRAWAPGAPVAAAAHALRVDEARIAAEPVVGVAAAAAELRRLAVQRYAEDALPGVDDVSAWYEVVADYGGAEGAAARASYVAEVYGLLERGIDDVAQGGERIVVGARALTLPELVLPASAAVGAEYPGALWSAASPSNYTPGRTGGSIQYIVIHTMQGSYAGSISWFRNPAASCSAHFNIRSSDGEITQMVSEGDTAWHAGNWTYNQRSIGIEHEGYIADPGRWYTEAMYASSARLVRHLCDKYGIPMDRAHIIAHIEVPGATHTDPGPGWDWTHYMNLVRGVPSTPPAPAYDATLVAKDHPAEMTSGDRAVAWIDLRNTGTATWSMGGTFVGTTGPRDHAGAFFDAENWVNDHRASGADHSDYGPGATGRFTFMITAPEVATDATITDTFGLVQEGVTWFGPEDVTFSVRVHPRVAPPPVEVDAGAPPPAEVDAGLPPMVGNDAGIPAPVGGDAGVVGGEGAAGRAMGLRSGCSAGGGGPGGAGGWLTAVVGLAVFGARTRRARRAS